MHNSINRSAWLHRLEGVAIGDLSKEVDVFELNCQVGFLRDFDLASLLDQEKSVRLFSVDECASTIQQNSSVNRTTISAVDSDETSGLISFVTAKSGICPSEHLEILVDRFICGESLLVLTGLLASLHSQLIVEFEEICQSSPDSDVTFDVIVDANINLDPKQMRRIFSRIAHHALCDIETELNVNVLSNVLPFRNISDNKNG